MRRTLEQAGGNRLEGLCEDIGNARDLARDAGARIEIGEGGDGIERLTARFAGRAFSPHRHDTYAIGMTLSGVQTFRYRGEQRYCLPGQCHVLHPDEMHDGGPASAEGFSYKIVYIDPFLIQQALGGRALPFLADPVVRSAEFSRTLLRGALDMRDPVDDLRRIDLAVSVAGLLQAAGAGDRAVKGPLRLDSLLRARERIAADPTARHSAQDLEGVTDLDRWTLARQFRAAFGTSPSRFRTMRQLEEARRMMRAGLPLAEAALDAGFADQSHMTRQFKNAYGLTPAAWMAALA